MNLEERTFGTPCIRRKVLTLKTEPKNELMSNKNLENLRKYVENRK